MKQCQVGMLPLSNENYFLMEFYLLLLRWGVLLLHLWRICAGSWKKIQSTEWLLNGEKLWNSLWVFAEWHNCDMKCILKTNKSNGKKRHAKRQALHFWYYMKCGMWVSVTVFLPARFPGLVCWHSCEREGRGDSAWQPRIRDLVEGAVILWLSRLINGALEVFRSSSPQNILVKSVSSPTRSYQKYFIYTTPSASDKEITMLIFSSWLSTELVIFLGSSKCQCLQYPCGTFWYQNG